VVALQLLMAELDLRPGPGLAYDSDGWDGYAADRARILRAGPWPARTRGAGLGGTPQARGNHQLAGSVRPWQ